MKSLSWQNKNKTAIRGAQLVPIEIPIICLCNLVPNIMKIQSALVISNSKGLSEIHRDTRTSTYQISRIEKEKSNNQISQVHM